MSIIGIAMEHLLVNGGIMKEEKPGGLRGPLGMVGAMGAMAICCGAPLL